MRAPDVAWNAPLPLSGCPIMGDGRPPPEITPAAPEAPPQRPEEAPPVPEPQPERPQEAPYAPEPSPELPDEMWGTSDFDAATASTFDRSN